MSIEIIRGIVVVSLVLMWVFFLVKVSDKTSVYNTVLRNNGPKSSYSFSKVQLLWWMIIVTLSFTISFANTGTAESVINSTCLILLGISIGTTAASKIIDNTEESDPTISRHQNDRTPRNFWIDILSDHNGVNLHRFQAFIFNVLFGLIFVIQFIGNGAVDLPEFDTTTLGLLGLSSAGFIGLKTGENALSARKNTASTPSTQGKTS